MAKLLKTISIRVQTRGLKKLERGMSRAIRKAKALQEALNAIARSTINVDIQHNP